MLRPLVSKIKNQQRSMLALLFLLGSLYSISHAIFIVQINLLHHGYFGYTGTSVFYFWYLLHSSMLGLLPYLLPTMVILVGVIARKQRLLFVLLMGGIAIFDLILAAGPLSSYPTYTMHHRGGTRYEGQVYYLADFGEKNSEVVEKQILYQCDSLGLICSSEFSIPNDDRKQILERIQ